MNELKYIESGGLWVAQYREPTKTLPITAMKREGENEAPNWFKQECEEYARKNQVL